MSLLSWEQVTALCRSSLVRSPYEECVDATAITSPQPGARLPAVILPSLAAQQLLHQFLSTPLSAGHHQVAPSLLHAPRTSGLLASAGPETQPELKASQGQTAAAARKAAVRKTAPDGAAGIPGRTAHGSSDKPQDALHDADGFADAAGEAAPADAAARPPATGASPRTRAGGCKNGGRSAAGALFVRPTAASAAMPAAAPPAMMSVAPAPPGAQRTASPATEPAAPATNPPAPQAPGPALAPDPESAPALAAATAAPAGQVAACLARATRTRPKNDLRHLKQLHQREKKRREQQQGPASKRHKGVAAARGGGGGGNAAAAAVVRFAQGPKEGKGNSDQEDIEEDMEEEQGKGGVEERPGEGETGGMAARARAGGGDGAELQGGEAAQGAADGLEPAVQTSAGREPAGAEGDGRGDLGRGLENEDDGGSGGDEDIHGAIQDEDVHAAAAAPSAARITRADARRRPGGLLQQQQQLQQKQQQPQQQQQLPPQRPPLQQQVEEAGVEEERPLVSIVNVRPNRNLSGLASVGVASLVQLAVKRPKGQGAGVSKPGSTAASASGTAATTAAAAVAAAQKQEEEDNAARVLASLLGGSFTTGVALAASSRGDWAEAVAKGFGDTDGASGPASRTNIGAVASAQVTVPTLLVAGYRRPGVSQPPGAQPQPATVAAFRAAAAAAAASAAAARTAAPSSAAAAVAPGLGSTANTIPQLPPAPAADVACGGGGGAMDWLTWAAADDGDQPSAGLKRDGAACQDGTAVTDTSQALRRGVEQQTPVIRAGPGGGGIATEAVAAVPAGVQVGQGLPAAPPFAPPLSLQLPPAHPLPQPPQLLQPQPQPPALCQNHPQPQKPQPPAWPLTQPRPPNQGGSGAHGVGALVAEPASSAEEGEAAQVEGDQAQERTESHGAGDLDSQRDGDEDDDGYYMTMAMYAPSLAHRPANGAGGGVAVEMDGDGGGDDAGRGNRGLGRARGRGRAGRQGGGSENARQQHKQQPQRQSGRKRGTAQLTAPGGGDGPDLAAAAQLPSAAGDGSMEVGLYADVKAFQRQQRKARGHNGGVDPTRPVPEVRGPTACKFWRLGRCTKGSQCAFAHVGQPVTRLLPCRHWRLGRCLRGETCGFSHDSKLPEPCVVMLEGGTCPDPGRCPMGHYPPEDMEALRDYFRDSAARAAAVAASAASAASAGAGAGGSVVAGGVAVAASVNCFGFGSGSVAAADPPPAAPGGWGPWPAAAALPSLLPMQPLLQRMVNSGDEDF